MPEVALKSLGFAVTDTGPAAAAGAASFARAYSACMHGALVGKQGLERARRNFPTFVLDEFRRARRSVAEGVRAHPDCGAERGFVEATFELSCSPSEARQ